jgi:diguanylate cyclase (GGDEF)-like protein/hemerythrin-like metal-binding protein/PAS domain S-box-containing protein
MLVGGLALGATALTSLYSYLLFHTIAELFSIIIGCGIFFMAWNSRQFHKDGYLLFIGIAYLYVASFDILHTMDFKGIMIFQGLDDNNLPPQIWLVARYIEAFSLFCAPIFFHRRLLPAVAFTGFSAISLVAFLAIFQWKVFPECFIPGVGLTIFKIASEYIIMIILAGAGTLLLHYKDKFEPVVLRLILLSILTTIVSEFCFTLFIDMYAISNMIGHLFKIISFWFMYQALIVTGMTRPYDLLFRDLQQEIGKHTRAEEELRQTAYFLRSLIAHANAPIIVWNPDFEITKFNHAFEQLTGRKATEVIGQNLGILFPPDQASRIIEDLLRTAAVGEQGETVQIPIQNVDGSIKQVLWNSATILDREGKKIIATIAQGQDITARINAETDLRKSMRKYKLLTENMKDVVWILDTETLYFTYISSSVERLRGYTAEEIMSVSAYHALAPEAQELITNALRTQAAAFFTNKEIQNKFYVSEVRQPCKDGTSVWTEAIVRYFFNEETGHVEAHGVTRDISDRKRMEATLAATNRKLAALSITDALTGIANRRRFDEALTKQYARHVRSGADLSLIMLDIDHFKRFNDQYGHVRGDACLQQIAQVIDECAVRSTDIAARYGGEEFACILPETDIDGAVIIAEKIRSNIKALAIPHKDSTISDYVTASIGVVTVTCTTEMPISEIIVLADKMLYKAKKFGRDRIASEAFTRPRHSVADKSFVQLTWNDTDCSGNSLIDSQHRELFHISNELFDAIQASRPTEAISAIVQHLLDAIAQHFQDEETILESTSFPDRARHAEEHARLLEKGVNLAQMVQTDPQSLGEIFKFLVYEVVFEHMHQKDREIFPFVGNAVAQTEKDASTNED